MLLRVLIFFLIPGRGVPIGGWFFFLQAILVFFSGFAVYSGGLLHLFFVFVFCNLVSGGVLGFCSCFIQRV